MKSIDLDTIRSMVSVAGAIDAMREALVAQAGGECDTPMPMHIGVEPGGGEIHVKGSARRGGRHVAVKIATGFPENAGRGLSTGNGLMLLLSARTGEPELLLVDRGWLTDLRTAAVTAMAARELGRADPVLGILGTGIQARLQARAHAEILPLRNIRIWGRSPDRAARCVEDVRRSLPSVEVTAAACPAEVAREARLIVTATASRAPLLHASDLAAGTHVSAVGSDAPGKQELDPEILHGTSLLLVDSRAQCARLGELQHAPAEAERAVELGAFCIRPVEFDRSGITVCDFTGLGVEDLRIAEVVSEALERRERGAPPA